MAACFDCLSTCRFSQIGTGGYRNSSCPATDKNTCWIYAVAQIYHKTWYEYVHIEGWLPVENAYVPGVCGQPDGGDKYTIAAPIETCAGITDGGGGGIES